MYTLFDFISSVNAIQYLLSLLFIVGFIIFYEILKPSPFEGLLKSFVEDVRFIKSRGRVMALTRKIALAPVYFFFYMAALPFLFTQGMAVLFGKRISAVTYAGWSPVRAYFAGRREVKKAKRKSPEQRTSD